MIGLPPSRLGATQERVAVVGETSEGTGASGASGTSRFKNIKGQRSNVEKLKRSIIDHLWIQKPTLHKQCRQDQEEDGQYEMRHSERIECFWEHQVYMYMNM